ncbi:N/A [soil metagenome]
MWSVLYKKGQTLKKAVGVSRGLFRRALLLFAVPGYDFVFIHREAAPIGPPIIEWIIAKVLRKKIIYDFDDAIWLPNTSVENKLIARFKWHSKVNSVCHWSYRVSCGNSFLAEYARQFNKNIIINATTIDTDNLHNPDRYRTIKETEKIVIGWTGTHSTMSYLTPMLPVIESLWKKYSHLELLIISDKDPNQPYPFIKFLPWAKGSEILDLMKMDIGIMPLTADEWSRGKCGFKALQYMSLMKPAIVSPTGVNSTIIDHNVNGFLSTTPEEWFALLEYLINHPERWGEIGLNGRQKVIDQYSVSSNSANFLSLFE